MKNGVAGAIQCRQLLAVSRRSEIERQSGRGLSILDLENVFSESVVRHLDQLPQTALDHLRVETERQHAHAHMGVLGELVLQKRLPLLRDGPAALRTRDC